MNRPPVVVVLPVGFVMKMRREKGICHFGDGGTGGFGLIRPCSTPVGSVSFGEIGRAHV